MPTLNGIRSCDTCRKARRALAAAGLDHDWHDLRDDGLGADRLDRWLDAVGWEALLNRRSTTWRSLPAEEREPLDAARARTLMLAHPTLVKRPVLEHAGGVIVGFRPADYEALADR